MIEFKHIAPFFTPFITVSGKGGKGDYFDLHLHTTASDSVIKPEFFVNFLKSKRYLISVTDHNEIAGSLKLKELGINCVPGIELGCSDGFEILVYFKTFEDLKKFFYNFVEPNRHPQRMARTLKDIFFFLDVLENFDCHISIPHISGYAQKNFLKNKEYIFEIIQKADSIETYNYTLNRSKNRIARHLRKEQNKYCTFGSDAHSENEIYSFSKKIIEEENYYDKFFNYFNKIKCLGSIGKKHLTYYLKNRKKSK